VVQYLLLCCIESNEAAHGQINNVAIPHLLCHPRPMKFVCASSLTLGREVFETIGDVVELPESDITSKALADADALIVRSKTPVNAELLEGTPVKFVGTATAGTDHVDEAFLQKAGIAFSSAAGCNAASVGQYITAAMVYLAEKYDFKLQDKTLGIVGHGHVGRQVQIKAEILGMKLLYSDPPLFDAHGDPRYIPLKELVPQCDILTLHVPLTEDGPNATRDFVTEEHLRAMPEGSFFINACRGEVVPSRAIETTLRDGHLQGAVLDVWNPEPEIPNTLLNLVDLGTAHVAGHSFEGKFNGTLICYQEACKHFDLDPSFVAAEHIPEVHAEPLEIAAGPSALSKAITASYDINHDDQLLRESIVKDRDQRIMNFRSLRTNYRMRREFEGTSVKLTGADHPLTEMLTRLGFTVAQ